MSDIEDITIYEFAKMVAETTGFQSEIEFDVTKQDKTMRKLMEASHLITMLWKPAIVLMVSRVPINGFLRMLKRLNPLSFSIEDVFDWLPCMQT